MGALRSVYVDGRLGRLKFFTEELVRLNARSTHWSVVKEASVQKDFYKREEEAREEFWQTYLNEQETAVWLADNAYKAAIRRGATRERAEKEHESVYDVALESGINKAVDVFVRAMRWR